MTIANMHWNSIATIPEDETVLVAAGEDWVFTAYMIVDQDSGSRGFFHSVDGKLFHHNHHPVAWMPLPNFPEWAP